MKMIIDDSLRAGRSGDRIPVVARFSAGAHTVPGTQPASCKMRTGSFLGIKRPGRGNDHPPPSSAEVKERVVHIYSPLWVFMACANPSSRIKILTPDDGTDRFYRNVGKKLPLLAV